MTTGAGYGKFQFIAQLHNKCHL